MSSRGLQKKKNVAHETQVQLTPPGNEGTNHEDRDVGVFLSFGSVIPAGWCGSSRIDREELVRLRHAKTHPSQTCALG